MAATEGDLRALSAAVTWRTPLVIVVCGCLIGMLTFGPRSTFGFFMQPMSREFSWGRDVFGLALAIQNLVWGIGQPIAGAIADRFGSLRVISVGALLYAAGLLLMRYAATPRHSGGSSLPNADSTRLNEQPDRPRPIRTPALISSDNGVAA